MKIQFLLGGSILVFLLGYLFTNSASLGICLQDDYQCREILNKIGDPLFYSMPALALVFIALLCKQSAFDTWKKFAVWFVPLATLLFVFYPMPGSGDLFAPYPEQIYQWVSALYVLISFGIIARHILLRRA